MLTPTFLARTLAAHSIYSLSADTMHDRTVQNLKINGTLHGRVQSGLRAASAIYNQLLVFMIMQWQSVCLLSIRTREAF